VYHSQWDDQKKQEYIKSKEKGTIFNRARFDIVASEMETRKRNYGNKITELSDIFKLKEKTISQ
jgi:hypothetical protein